MKKLLTLIALTTTCLLLSGCGVVERVDEMQSLHTMIKSRDAYTACLTTHPRDSSSCDGYQKAYKANMEAYRAQSDEAVDINTSHN